MINNAVRKNIQNTRAKKNMQSSNEHIVLVSTANMSIIDDFSNHCFNDLSSIVFNVHKWFLGTDACKEIYCDSVKSTDNTLSIDFSILAYSKQLEINQDNECNNLLCRYINTRKESDKMCNDIFQSFVNKNTYNEKINSFKIVSTPCISAYVNKQSESIDLDKSKFYFTINIKIELNYD